MRPSPASTYSVWPSGCVCHAVRAPGWNETEFATSRAGAEVAITGSCSTVPVKYSGGAVRVGREPAGWKSMGLPLLVDVISWLLLLAGGVARLGLGVHRIKARQRRAVIHLVDDPPFHPLLLRPLGQYAVDQRLRDQHRAVLIGDHNIVRKYRTPAAAARLP